MKKDLVFYDIEVYAYNAFVIFKDIDKNVLKIFHNNFDGLRDFVKDKILVGYNNYFYDDLVLSKMMKSWNNTQLKEFNDRIIKGENKDKTVDRCIDSLDCFQQIDVAKPGLKKIEGNMGKMILESNVSFDIDRPLTQDELKEAMDYCEYDVDTTIDIYKLRENSYFKTKEMLVKKLGNKKAKRWNTTTISGNLLTGKIINKWASLRVPEHMMEMVDPEIKEMWRQVNLFVDDLKVKTITKTMFDNDIQFGFGGLHGAPNRPIKVKNVKLLDVTSMYPNIILNINALNEATEEYRKILERRIEIKHKDKLESDALKLILNSVYGNLNNQYSVLNNPKAAYSVCVYGQIALFELCKRLSSTCRIININTDGVAFTTNNDRYLKVKEQWEKDFNLKLEEDNFDLFIQKDVNNYIGVKGDKIKCKGGDVNKYNEDKFFSNNNARIIDIAIVDYLVYGKSVLDTLLENRDKPYLYQYILQAGRTYQGTFDEYNKKYQNINRVFACRNHGISLYKKRIDGGLVKFADTPEHMFLWNKDCAHIPDFKNIIDINHYYQIINKKLSAWSV
ncbi:hypothetical protein [Leptotrichia shahii]|uniref:hypothetical protein n=1 Tax=Leptotrichia shahii TaxID=157691 RepID=UPI0028D6BC62|nr:hypothetical protein [Leptotrichia shahii]